MLKSLSHCLCACCSLLANVDKQRKMIKVGHILANRHRSKCSPNDRESPNLVTVFGIRWSVEQHVVIAVVVVVVAKLKNEVDAIMISYRLDIETMAAAARARENCSLKKFVTNGGNTFFKRRST